MLSRDNTAWKVAIHAFVQRSKNRQKLPVLKFILELFPCFILSTRATFMPMDLHS